MQENGLMVLNDRPRISIFIATSIDGYIAKKDGDIDWLVQFNPPTEENEDKDCGFSRFFSNVDVLIMGKNTYDVVSKFSVWPYQGKRVVILSSTLTSVREEAELFNGDITHLIQILYADGVNHVYIDGGMTISQFLNAHMVDHMIISIIPVVLGSGIPLFANISKDRWCQLVSSKTYSNGLVQIRYDVIK